MSKTGFENQLKTERELDAFIFLEVVSRSSNTDEDIERVFERMLKKYPEAKSYNWVDPLRKSVIEYNRNKEEDDHLSVRDYVRSIRDRYVGSVLLLVKNCGPKGLSGFSEDELSQPHMEWVKIVDKKYHEYEKMYPEIRTSSYLSMAMYSTIDNLSNEELFKLRTDFFSKDSEYGAAMDFSDWVDWYVKSSKLFDSEGSISPDIATRMFKVLNSWKDDTNENNLYGLSRNFEFHPYHNDALLKWIVESKEIIENQNSNENSLSK